MRAFREAEKRLEPEFVYIIGRKIVDLEPECGIMYLNNSSMNNYQAMRQSNTYTPNRKKRIVEL